jgi:type I restriction enzyme R subunit
MLFVGRQAVVVEAKKEGTPLSGVDIQSKKYLDGLPSLIQRVQRPLPFAYESTGVETVFWFHRPETLVEWASQLDTLQERLKTMRRCRVPISMAGVRQPL